MRRKLFISAEMLPSKSDLVTSRKCIFLIVLGYTPKRRKKMAKQQVAKKQVAKKQIAKKQLVLVLSEPAEGETDEFNRYYENLHLDEVLETTGWKTAQRYQLVEQAGQECPLPYLAVYEAESVEGKSAIARMNETRSQRQQSGSLNRRTAGAWIFEAIGPEHKKER
jgi:hypothetical protein|tara:strand:+ start:756 stop:1253 length:498 start_codon:yes stop_codon:yes gene_type:complete